MGRSTWKRLEAIAAEILGWINFGPTKYSGTVTYKPNGGHGKDFEQII